MAKNGLALTAIGAGIIFTWSGIRGWSVLATIGDLIAGKAPSTSESLTLTAAGFSSAVGKTGSAIADDAIRYAGHAYLYGGSPGRNGTNPWDCSSFCNWVIGHDTGNAIPGFGPGKYDGTTHGPPTGSWAIWPGARRVSRAELSPGDVIVWATHMGIYIGQDKMISAESPQNGTRIGDVSNPNKLGLGPVLKYGRVV